MTFDINAFNKDFRDAELNEKENIIIDIGSYMSKGNTVNIACSRLGDSGGQFKNLMTRLLANANEQDRQESFYTG
ncbi:MAG: hypothetical protein S4CHLAM20_09160 [Chlamydiia bacterium]|nr:hypothetical protein [Chlamydiia bacterium]